MLGLSSIRKLFGGLARTREDLGRRLTDALRGGRLDEAGLEAIEEALIGADVGVATAARVIEAVRERARGQGDMGGQELRELVASELASSLEEVSADAGASKG